MFSKTEEVLDVLEVDLRVRLAELQRRYKDKQGELGRIQRHTDRR